MVRLQRECDRWGYGELELESEGFGVVFHNRSKWQEKTLRFNDEALKLHAIPQMKQLESVTV